MTAALEIIIKEQESTFQTSEILPLSIIAMGKLGAEELNFSSDVDLIFVCANEEDIKDDVHQYHKNLISIIRKLSKLLEEITEDGYLYRHHSYNQGNELSLYVHIHHLVTRESVFHR